MSVRACGKPCERKRTARTPFIRCPSLPPHYSMSSVSRSKLCRRGSRFRHGAGQHGCCPAVSLHEVLRGVQEYVDSARFVKTVSKRTDDHGREQEAP